MPWGRILLSILLLLGLTLMLRFGVRLTSRAGRTSLALQVGGISVLRLPLGEKRPPKVGKRKKRKRKRPPGAQSKRTLAKKRSSPACWRRQTMRALCSRRCERGSR